MVELDEKGLWKPVLPGQAPVELEQLQSRLHRATLGIPEHERLVLKCRGVNKAQEGVMWGVPLFWGGPSTPSPGTTAAKIRLFTPKRV